MDDEKKKELLRLDEQGCRMRKIAKRLALSRKTVRKVLEAADRLPSSPPDRVTPAGRTSKLDRFRDLIRKEAEQGLGSPRILRELQKLGYDGGRTILVDYLREIRPPKVSRARRRFETAPGEEAQADWSPYRVEIGGQTRTVHAFSMVLAFSRKLHIRFYRDEKLPTLLYAMEEAFRDMQGTARRLVLDNMTTVTLGRVNRRPVFHERFLEFARHYMFEPVVCRPYDPDRKGKVERPFHYLEHDFLASRTFASLADLNEEVQRWLREVANVRVHGTTRRVPDQVWENEERALLIRLPERPFGSYRQEVRQVQLDGLISVDSVRYSVPSHLAGAQVTVRSTPSEIEVLDALGNRVAMHPISEAQGAFVIDPTHQPPRQRPGRRELEDDVLRRFPGAAEFVAGLRRRHGAFAHLHLAKLRRLAMQHPVEDVLGAIQHATELRGFSAHTVARLLDRTSPTVEEPPSPLNGHAILEALEDDDEGDGLAQYRNLEKGETE